MNFLIIQSQKKISFINYDFYQKVFNIGEVNDITIVDIDEKSIAKIGQFPWRRDIYSNILKNLSKMDNTKSDIALCSNGKILETGTSNIIFIKDNKYYSPIRKFYRGVNLKFFEKQFKIKKTNININKLNQYEEILLIGSGKGVSTVSSIKEKDWNRKKYKSYETFISKYQTKILKQKKLSNYL